MKDAIKLNIFRISSSAVLAPVILCGLPLTQYHRRLNILDGCSTRTFSSTYDNDAPRAGRSCPYVCYIRLS